MTITTRYNARCIAVKWNGVTLLYGLSRSYMYACPGILIGGNNSLGSNNFTLMPYCQSWLAQDMGRVGSGSPQQPLKHRLCIYTVIMLLTLDNPPFIYLVISLSLSHFNLHVITIIHRTKHMFVPFCTCITQDIYCLELT